MVLSWVGSSYDDHSTGLQRIHLHDSKRLMHWNFEQYNSMMLTNEPQHDKTNKLTVRPAKTQISLGIHPVWSESSLSAWRKLGSLATHWAHSEDSDQPGRMPRLIRVFAGRTVTLLVLSCRGSNVNYHVRQRLSFIETVGGMKMSRHSTKHCQSITQCDQSGRKMQLWKWWISGHF